MRRWIRRILQMTTIAAMLPTTAAVAQKAPKTQARTPDKTSAQAALFKTYQGLDAQLTRELMAKIEKEPKRHKVLTRISDALTKPKVTSKQLEKDLLALVQGATPAQVEVLLDAIMRDHYDRHVAARATKASAQALGKELERKADVLESAVYGFERSKTRSRSRVRSLRSSMRRRR